MTFVSTVPTSLVICSFFFYRYGARPDPHSFPTRRSSDLPCDSWHASHDGLTPVSTASKGEAELTGLKGSSRVAHPPLLPCLRRKPAPWKPSRPWRPPHLGSPWRKPSMESFPD